MKTLLLGLTAVMFVSSAVYAQKEYQPTCTNNPGTYIPNEELQAYLQTP